MIKRIELYRLRKELERLYICIRFDPEKKGLTREIIPYNYRLSLKTIRQGSLIPYFRLEMGIYSPFLPRKFRRYDFNRAVLYLPVLVYANTAVAACIGARDFPKARTMAAALLNLPGFLLGGIMIKRMISKRKERSNGIHY